MVWMTRRLLIPFAVGSVVCTIFLLIVALSGTDTEVSLGLHDLALAGLFVLPFQAVGLALLVPIALLLCGLSLPRPAYPILLAIVGAALGAAIVLPISDRPLPGLGLPSACGALSGLIWFAFNRDAVKRLT
jgi:hypothetical protein